MKKSKEKDELAGIIRILVLDGWLVLRLNSGAFKVDDRYFRAYIVENTGDSDSAPDILAWKEEKALLIETKRRGNKKLRKGQIAFKELAREKGVQVHVLDRWEDILKVIGAEEKFKL